MADADPENHDFLDGLHVSLAYCIPFVTLLLCISFIPLFFPHFWHKFYGPIAFLHAFALLIPMFVEFKGDMFSEFLAAMLHEYIPFLALIFALFTTAGGICVTHRVRLTGSPFQNTLILGIGTVIASWMGTTGASLLLIRPLIRGNKWRRFKTHTFVYFIFLVANVGGSLSPLGDPPLFLGFLKGVEFAWFTANMIGPMAFVAGCLLICYFGLDAYFYYRKEDPADREKSLGLQESAAIKLDFENDDEDLIPGSRPTLYRKIKGMISGWRNIPLLLLVPVTVLVTGILEVKNAKVFEIAHVGLDVEDVVRDCLLYGIGLISVIITPKRIRERNGFSWFPIQEVSQLFFGIFVTIIPAVAILKAGEQGSLGFIIKAVSDDAGRPLNIRYFWLTGGLSSFLDNAPTFLIFFNIAGGQGNVLELMTSMKGTLLAISTGAVFLGAMTYIGNAPNFMVKAIVEDQGHKMPSFMVYVLWALLLLAPFLAACSLIFFL